MNRTTQTISVKAGARLAVVVAALVLLFASASILAPALGSDIPHAETPLDAPTAVLGLIGVLIATEVLKARARVAGVLR